MVVYLKNMDLNSWCFLSKNKISPIIFLETPYSDVNTVLYGYIKSINCLNKNDNFFCGECTQCKKIDTKSYFDLVELNGFQKNITHIFPHLFFLPILSENLL